MTTIHNINDSVVCLHVKLPVQITDTRWIHDEVLHHIIRMLDTKQKCTLYFDTSQIKKLPIIPCIKVMVAFMKEYDPKLRLFLKGSAMLVTTKLARSFLTMLFKVKPPVAPLKLVKSEESGYEFLRSLC